REKLIPLLEHPPETSVVVFVAESIDEREKFFKQLKKSSAVMVQARTPYEDKVPQWIQYIAKKFNKKIDDRGVAYLLKTVGSNLQDLKNEISKAAIYVGEQSVITLEALQTVASPLRETTIFDLTNAVGMGETKEAIHELQKLLTIGEPEPKILTMLVRQWRLIWRACTMLDHGNPPAVVTERLKVHKFFRAEFLNQCSQHDVQILRKRFPLFYETDLRLKRSAEDKRLALEELTLRLCQN
ncbi:MAG TPA: DNA polymerase III subunit delta, partial [Bdellovibrionota bacterium]|nr:DNA polymerase III subunit delta [Bdellovibrionota bacterium]